MIDIGKPLLEGLTELGRIALIAIIPIMIDGLLKGIIDWRLIGISALIAVLKAIDKFLHKLGVQEDNDSLTLGLTRF